MIVIVGAGLAGLVCAKCLAEAGVRDFVVLEAEAAPGGRVRSQRTPDGFILDRGFQVLLDSYPAVRRHLDLPALRPRYFESGAILHDRGRSWTVADPRQCPRDLPVTALGGMFPLADKARLVALVGELLLTPDDRLLAACAASADVSTAHFLWARGFSAAITERFFRPFFGGVFLDEKLGTSAGLFRYYLKKFATGRALVPAGGIGEIPRQLARRLPAGALRLGCRVERLARVGDQIEAVRTDQGDEIPCETLLLATDAPAAARLLDRPPVGNPPHGTTAVYFASDLSLYDRAMLALPAGRGRLVRHFAQLTNVAPEYAPPGQHLLCATVLDRRGLADDALFAAAAAEIAEVYPPAAGSLRPLSIVEVPYGQHQQPASFAARLAPAPAPTHLDNVWLAGDQTGACSIQSAMAGGERAARLLARPTSQ